MPVLPGNTSSHVAAGTPTEQEVAAPKITSTQDAEEQQQATPNPPVNPEVAAPDPQRLVAEQGDDLSAAYANHREEVSDDDAWGEMRQYVAGGNSVQQTEAATKQAVASLKASTKGQPYKPREKKTSTTLDVLTGIGEGAVQAVGGAGDAAQQFLNAAKEVSVAGQLLKANDIDITLPKVPESKSATGGAIRKLSQFATGYLAAGGVVAGEGVVAGMAKGALTDFATFDGNDERFSNIIQNTPLANPVNEFLAAKPDDPEVVGRLKNALEGLGVGAAVEGVMKIAQYIRAGRAAKAIEEAAPIAKGPDFSVLGDPEGDFFVQRASNKLEQAGRSTKDINPEDLTGPTTMKEPAKIDVNFARINGPQDVKDLIQEMVNRGEKDINKARRGVRTWEETKLSADQKDAYDLLVNRRKGQPFNAEESLAVRQLWVSSANKLRETALAASQSTDPAVLLSFRKQLMNHHWIQQEVIAARTETGRALNAWKIPASGSAEAASQIDEILQASGGADMARDMAEKIAKLGDAKMSTQLEQFVNGTAFARTREAVLQVWINSLLSNPATHVVNSLSNFSVMGQQVLERGAAGVISKVMGTQNGVELGEALAMIHGMSAAFRDGIVAMSKKITNPNLLDSVRSSVEAPFASMKQEARAGALSAETWNVNKNAGFGSFADARDTIVGHSLDVLDVATTVPGRLLSKSDSVFKSLGYRMELHAQATRQAMREMRGGIISPEGLKTRIAAIIENPPENIKLEAVNAATYMTFQNKPAASLKKLGDAIQGFTPLGIPLGRILIPFKNTPINIGTYAFERSPLAPLVKTWRADIAAGGARANIATARMATGTMVMSMATDMAMSGLINGKGPEEPGQRANWIAQGNKPYSFKIGNEWHAFNRLDPIGFTMGLAADYAEAVSNAKDDISDKDFEKVMVGAAFAISNNVMSKQYLQGIAELTEAVGDPQGKGHAYLKRLAGSAVPAGVASIARNGVPGVIEGDPYMREADGIMDALRRRIPGLSKDLPLYRDLFGRPVDYRSGKGWMNDVFNPIYIKKINPEPIDTELGRLEFYPSMPKRQFEFDGTTISLNPKQYSRYLELSGNGIKDPKFGMGMKDYLNALVTGKHPYSADYKLRSDGPDGAKKRKIEQIMEDFKGMAKERMMAEDAELRAQYQEKKVSNPGKYMPEVYGR